MSSKMPLSAIRTNITELDQHLLELLAKRRQLSLSVAQSKADEIRNVRDQQREEELMISLIQRGRKLGLDAHYITSLYQTIIEDSVLNQQAYLQQRANPQHQHPLTRVAFLGSKGSYSYLASHRYFSRRVEKISEMGCNSFRQIISLVEAGQADYGVLPIENTSSGSINEVYDLLQHTSLSIVGELTQPVEHCLLTAVDTTIDKITTIYAHAQPYQQCSQFLASLGKVKIEYCDSTAAAMAKVSELKRQDAAVIGSLEGGKLYQLHAIKRQLANQKENHSRFILVARKAIDVAVQLPAKTTLIMATEQKSGALVDALLVLRDNHIKMSKLESRPIQGNPWEEMFYLDVEANLQSPQMQAALKGLSEHTRFIKVLGCYPSETIKATEIPDVLLETNTPT